MTEHTITLQHDGRRAFNASLCRFNGAMLLAYRVSYNDKPDRLWLARLNPDLSTKWCMPLDVPLADGWGAEDPRLFVHDGTLHVAWTAADYTRSPWRATMFYGRVETWGPPRVEVAHQPRYGLNLSDQREKNWQFFSLGGCLFAQYQASPQRVIQLVGDRVVGEWTSPGFAWGHGRPSGGTPPIRTNRGTLLTFFHAFTPHTERQRLYNFGAMEFSPVAPFQILRVSPGPIMTASDRWPVTSDGWSPLCVFPGGAIDHGDGWLVSAGVNDNGIRLFELYSNDVPLANPTSLPVEERGYFRAMAGFLFGGRVRTPGEIIEVDLFTARKLLTRNWIAPYENQTA